MSLVRSAVKFDKNDKKQVASGQICSIFCRLFLALFAIGLWSVPPAWGQSGYATGTVRGIVFDAQGAVVPNATVMVKNPETGTTRGTVTSPDGTYQVLSLNPGTYAVEVHAPGFKKEIADQVVVTVGQTVVIDAHLSIGTANATVEVTGNSAPLIDTAQTQQANTINDRQEVNLPNISRNFAQTIYTLPGIVDSTAPSIQDPNIGTGYQTSGFSIGGSNGRSNLFTIDGGQNDYGSGAPRVAHVPQDSVQEFQVNRNSFGAEFGYTVGSAINVITKSGTNKFHGNAFGYIHDENTDAANYFNSFGPSAGTKPFEQSVIYGGSFGGPIKRDKLFFFTSYERQKLDSNVTVNLVDTAAAQGVAGQTNGFNGTSCPAPVTQACYLTQLAATGSSIDPRIAGLGAYFLGSSIFTPIKDPIYNALISPNSGTFDGNANGAAVQAPPNQQGRYNNWVTRLDYQPNQANSFSLRFSLSRESNQVTGPDGVPRFTSIVQALRDYTITTSWNHVFNPNLVNTVRVQVVPDNSSKNVAPHPGGAEFDLGSLGIQGTPFDFPYNQRQNQYQFDDDLSWTKGKHNMKFGESYRPVQYDIFQAFLFGGEYEYFDGAIPIIDLYGATPYGNLQESVAAFNLTNGYPITGPPTTNLSASQLYVVGLPLALLQGSGNGQYNATTNPIGFYAQDSWKALPNLTLNYGGRLDIDPVPDNYPTHTFFSPRLGVALDTFGNGKTVLRAGAGLFTAPVLFIVPFTSTTLSGNANHVYASVVTAPNQIGQLEGAGALERSLATIANPNPALSLGQLSSLGINIVPSGPNQQNGAFFSVSPNFKAQYSLQASASIAQQLAPNLSLEVAYQFYRGVHIQQIQEANYIQNSALPIDPFVGPFYTPKPGSTNGQPNTQIVENDQTTSDGSSNYNGLTTSLTKRYGRGLQFQVNYTYSSALDNTSDFSSQSTPFRPGLLNRDYARSSFNITNSFVANAVYTSPARIGGSVESALLSNFTIAPIVSVRSGVPFTILVPGIESNGTSGHTSEARPFNEERNQGKGPGYASFDMRISKAIVLKKDSSLRLELIAQAANILNHTNFTSVQNIFPNTAVTDPTTGLTTSAVASTPEGNVNLLNGPYNYKGFRPNGPSQLSDPLAFESSAPPRQISFGMELSF
ncbi:TonB-dependent receptor [Tunturibacter psychrotolerans]|uniref:TonB-dependent receptor n=1 Tax=Tunturiibacter psychrotolerans TaxID=3069686 RepID=A0AAU7ZMT6_9BACT